MVTCRGDDDECCDADGLVPMAVMAATISDGPYQLATQVLLVSTGMVIITILVTFFGLFARVKKWEQAIFKDKIMSGQEEGLACFMLFLLWQQ